VQWQECAGFLTSLKGCINTKKVENHWFNARKITTFFGYPALQPFALDQWFSTYFMQGPVLQPNFT